MDQQDFIGLDFGRKFDLGCSGLSLFCFLFSLVWRGTRNDPKIRFVTKAGDCFTPPSYYWFSFIFFSFGNSAHCSHIVWSEDPFFSIFLCFSSIFDWFFLFSFSFPFLFFIFLFFFFQCTSLTQGKRSFSWRIFQFFLPRVRWEISILGQGYGQKVDVWLKRPTNGGTWFMSDICLANGSGIRECPDYFHENAYYDN